MNSFVLEFRTGFGFDIEANDQVCYFVLDEEEKPVLVQFDGLIINLPLLKIHWGRFDEVVE